MIPHEMNGKHAVVSILYMMNQKMILQSNATVEVTDRNTFTPVA
jgi:hypothetical protein